MADTGFKSPTATGEDYNTWTDPANAYSSNDAYASHSTAAGSQDYYNFTFNVPSGATINGVEVSLEAFVDGTVVINGDGAKILCSLSEDGGASQGTANATEMYTIAEGETTKTLGGATSGDAYWGLTLTDGDFSNTNFRVSVTVTGSFGGATGIYLDHVQVKVYYTEAAGVTIHNLTLLGVGV